MAMLSRSVTLSRLANLQSITVVRWLTTAPWTPITYSYTYHHDPTRVTLGLDPAAVPHNVMADAANVYANGDSLSLTH